MIPEACLPDWTCIREKSPKSKRSISRLSFSMTTFQFEQMLEKILITCFNILYPTNRPAKKNRPGNNSGFFLDGLFSQRLDFVAVVKLNRHTAFFGSNHLSGNFNARQVVRRSVLLDGNLEHHI